jgi:hypothetical protein
MTSFLTHYTNPSSPGYRAWMAASLLTANGKGKSSWWARELREATKAYVKDRINVPSNLFGRSTSSYLDDPDIANEIHEHLQSVGAYVCAEDIVDYLNRDEVKARLELKKNHLTCDCKTLDEAHGLPLGSRPSWSICRWP